MSRGRPRIDTRQVNRQGQGIESFFGNDVDRFGLHERYLNAQMVRVLRTIGFDRRYVRAEGPYLFDDTGERYLSSPLFEGIAEDMTDEEKELSLSTPGYHMPEEA